ncbi:hypothetical protein BCR44DRAFT_285197 [Catenaria anguillulae PL171]|uniref:Uncharacterized protein n=1 Tax=Catenaria anguillulae PL171 TaxID=765915 RepID=A0A1Y2HRL3_9FUNG|nr:hypothetical protein BCR44DRAFT_285197 [Catenaria anguillulae PL171]
MSDDHDPTPPSPTSSAARAGDASANPKATTTATAAAIRAKVGNKKHQRQKQRELQHQQLMNPPPIPSAAQFLPFLGPSPSAAAASDAIAAAATALANGSSQQLMSAMQHFLANSAASTATDAPSGSTSNLPASSPAAAGARNPMSELMFQPQLNQLHTTADHVRAFHALADLIDKFSTLPPPTPADDPLTSAIPGLFTKGSLAFIPLATVPLVDNGLSLAQSVIISDATKLRMDSGDLHVDRYMIQRSAIIMQLPPILAMRALSRASLQREGIALAPVIKDVSTVLQFMLRPLKYDRRKAPLVARLEMSHAKLLVTILMDFVHDMFINTNAPPCTCAAASSAPNDNKQPTPSSSRNPSPAPSPNAKQKSSSTTTAKPKSACLIPRPLLQSLLDYLSYCADPAHLPSLGDQAIQILALCDMYAWLHDEHLHICTALEDMPADVLHRFVGALARCYAYPVPASKTSTLVPPPTTKADKPGSKPAGAAPPSAAAAAAAKESKPAPPKSAAASAAKEKSKPSSASSTTASTTAAASPDSWLIRVPDHWQLAAIINARRARTVHTMFSSAGSVLDPDTADHTPCRSGIRELKFSLGPRLDITVEENEDEDDDDQGNGDDDDEPPERANPLLLRDAAGYVVRAIAKHQVSAQFCSALIAQMPEGPLSSENATQVEAVLSLTWLALAIMERGPQHIPVEGNHPKGKETTVRVFAGSVMSECQTAVASKDVCCFLLRFFYLTPLNPLELTDQLSFAVAFLAALVRVGDPCCLDLAHIAYRRAHPLARCRLFPIHVHQRHHRWPCCDLFERAQIAFVNGCRGRHRAARVACRPAGALGRARLSCPRVPRHAHVAAHGAAGHVDC